MKISWPRDNKSLNYITENASKSLLWRQSLDNPSAVLIADFGNEEIEDCAFSPEGRDFCFIRGKWLMTRS